MDLESSKGENLDRYLEFLPHSPKFGIQPLELILFPFPLLAARSPNPASTALSRNRKAGILLWYYYSPICSLHLHSSTTWCGDPSDLSREPLACLLG
jgi:hypothetical protein